MAPTATGSKARWVLQARLKACMGWSWAAVYRGAGISWWLPAYILFVMFSYLTLLVGFCQLTVCKVICCMYVILLPFYVPVILWSIYCFSDSSFVGVFFSS